MAGLGDRLASTVDLTYLDKDVSGKAFRVDGLGEVVAGLKDFRDEQNVSSQALTWGTDSPAL